MENAEIKQTLREYIVNHYGVPADDAEFNDTVHLFDYGYVDSFGAVDLVSFVQERFGVTVSQGDLIAYPLNSITEIADFVTLRERGEL